MDRSVEKRASRERDMDDIRHERVTTRDVARRNDFFANLDVSHFKLVAVGGKPFVREEKEG